MQKGNITSFTIHGSYMYFKRKINNSSLCDAQYRLSFHVLHCSRNAHLQEQSRTSVHSQVSRDLINLILKT